MFIDTHAHLYLPQFEEDINEVMLNAKDKHVHKIFLPNIDSSSIKSLHHLCKQYPDQCYPLMGLHPCSVKENYKEEIAIIKDHLSHHKYYGIGETGIDLYWDKTFVKEQLDAFEEQIKLALEYDLPIIIHSRDSLDLTIETIEKNYEDSLTGVFHCFNGNEKQAQRIIDLGFYMGLGGVITFKNSGMQDLLEKINLDCVVLETDAPYLSPVPYRGKRNESSYIPLIAERLANLRGCSIKSIQEQTTKNALALYKIENIPD